MSKIFVVGSINMDLTMRAKRMPERGETLTGDGFLPNPGGKGANQAVACAKLGGDCRMVGCVGEPFGGELLSALRGYGVDTRFVAVRKGVTSGIAVILVTEGDNRILLEGGANATADEALVDRALAEAEAGDFLVCQLEIPVPTVCYALKRAKEKGMVTVLNPAPAAPLPEGALALCDYFTPNQSEAQFYTGIYPEGEQSYRACARRLTELGASNVLITVGKAGCVYFGEEGYLLSPAYPLQAVDTTAAGDTFMGAFVVALTEGKGIGEALAFSNRAAALTVTRQGAQQSIPYREEVEKLQ